MCHVWVMSFIFIFKGWIRVFLCFLTGIVSLSWNIFTPCWQKISGLFWSHPWTVVQHPATSGQRDATNKAFLVANKVDAAKKWLSKTFNVKLGAHWSDLCTCLCFPCFFFLRFFMRFAKCIRLINDGSSLCGETYRYCSSPPSGFKGRAANTVLQSKSFSRWFYTALQSHQWWPQLTLLNPKAGTRMNSLTILMSVLRSVSCGSQDQKLSLGGGFEGCCRSATWHRRQVEGTEWTPQNQYLLSCGWRVVDAWAGFTSGFREIGNGRLHSGHWMCSWRRTVSQRFCIVMHSHAIT